MLTTVAEVGPDRYINKLRLYNTEALLQKRLDGLRGGDLYCVLCSLQIVHVCWLLI